MSMKRRALAVLSVLPIVVACSGAGSSSGIAAGSSDAASFISSYCGYYAKCCGKVNKPTDGAQCRNLFGALTTNEVYDPVKGSTCLNELGAASSAADFCDNAGSSKGAPSCNGTFTTTGTGGSKKPGDPCTSTSECASSTEGKVQCQTYFVSGSSSETRICQVQIPGKAGDTPCVGTVDGNITTYPGSGTPVGRGYLCDKGTGTRCDSKSSACVALAASGADCSGSDACVAGAYCNTSTSKCADRLAGGADCTPTGFSDACQDKFYCDTTTKKCTAALADGQPCTSSQTCASHTCVNKACGPSSGNSFSLALLCGP